jgi:hypothetical protein
MGIAAVALLLGATQAEPLYRACLLYGIDYAGLLCLIVACGVLVCTLCTKGPV